MTGKRLHIPRLACALASALFLAASSALANPPDLKGTQVVSESKEDAEVARCQTYEKERAELLAAGVAADLEKGPVWAKANLSAQRLQQVLRFIRLDEQVRFRCSEVHADAAVRQTERRARIAAARGRALQRQWEEKQARMPEIIQPPVRTPTRLVARRSANAKGIPPLPSRAPR